MNVGTNGRYAYSKDLENTYVVLNGVLLDKRPTANLLIEEVPTCQGRLHLEGAGRLLHIQVAEFLSLEFSLGRGPFMAVTEKRGELQITFSRPKDAFHLYVTAKVVEAM